MEINSDADQRVVSKDIAAQRHTGTGRFSHQPVAVVAVVADRLDTLWRSGRRDLSSATVLVVAAVARSELSRKAHRLEPLHFIVLIGRHAARGGERFEGTAFVVLVSVGVRSGAGGKRERDKQAARDCSQGLHAAPGYLLVRVPGASAAPLAGIEAQFAAAVLLVHIQRLLGGARQQCGSMPALARFRGYTLPRCHAIADLHRVAVPVGSDRDAAISVCANLTYQTRARQHGGAGDGRADQRERCDGKWQEPDAYRKNIPLGHPRSGMDIRANLSF